MTQTVALAFVYEPASQVVHEVGETVAVEVDTEPGGHLMQKVAFTTKNPEGQGRQTELPVDEMVPRGQGRHDDSAVALGKELKEPEGQEAHENAPRITGLRPVQFKA